MFPERIFIATFSPKNEREKATTTAAWLIENARFSPSPFDSLGRTKGEIIKI